MSDMERRGNERRVTERGEDRRRGTDTLRSNPEVMERRDAQRENPEVMGRSEPQTMTAPRHSETWNEMSDVRMRFDQLQSEFIDDPKSAVKKAEKLMDDMLEKMRERIHNTHRDVEKNDDTEHLRLAMRSYRDMIDSFGGGRRSV
jgi:Txe/YoeB family toxin of Txe-Axe toxin-antitoxin module